MAKKWRNLFCAWMLLTSILLSGSTVMAEEKNDPLSLATPEYVLMELETGTVLLEKEKDTRRSPASVTKIMTLLLIFDHIEKGDLCLEDMVTTSAYAKSMGGSQKDTRRSPASVTKIMTLLLIFDHIEKGDLCLEDMVTTSAYAKSMGGSQVFLEEGESQSVETMIKCIVIASGNDASVAMAEHISGSETEFVKEMNQRAAGLGMKNTHFEDCCGLTDSDDHYTTSYDIALMSRELIKKYPQILSYSSIWMDTIIHNTRQGSKEFGLSNTNRLIRSYQGCVGLKTGSTSKAKFCLSAVAERKGITLIAVVMASPDSKTRARDAAWLRRIPKQEPETPHLFLIMGLQEPACTRMISL